MNEKLILKGALAHAAGSFAKGFMGDSSPNAADLHNEYAAMPEHRQRRFWVRFYHLSSDNFELVCLNLIQRQLAANAAHAAINHYVGDETDSPAEQSENMPEERERRFWVRLFS